MEPRYKIITLPLAKEEILAAARWYSSRKKGLGKRFRIAVTAGMNRLKINPHIGTIPCEEIRWIGVEKFPYQIHYYISEADAAIIVTAVYATARNPFWD